MSRFNELIEILQEVRSIVNRPSTDVFWSHYNTTDELIADLDLYIEKLKCGQESVVGDLKLLFAPTGDLQEVSLGSGWADMFIEIAERFDKLVD